MKLVSLPRAVLTLFLLVSAAVFIAHYSHLLAFDRAALGKYYPFKWLLAGHVAAAAIALLLGPVQFVRAFRNRWLRLHRISGTVYAVAILVSAVSALGLTFSTTMQVGMAYTISLWALLFVWFTSTATAYLAVVKKRIKEHEAWMARSYICTFAFVVQNYALKLLSFDTADLLAQAGPSIIWFSWSVPLFVHQVWVTFGAAQPRAQQAVGAVATR